MIKWTQQEIKDAEEFHNPGHNFLLMARDLQEAEATQPCGDLVKRLMEHYSKYRGKTYEDLHTASERLERFRFWMDREARLLQEDKSWFPSWGEDQTLDDLLNSISWVDAVNLLFYVYVTSY